MHFSGVTFQGASDEQCSRHEFAFVMRLKMTKSTEKHTSFKGYFAAQQNCPLSAGHVSPKIWEITINFKEDE